MLPVPLAGIDRSRECLFEVNQVIFEDLNETQQQMGGHPSSTTSRLNLMRLRDVLALDPRFAVRSGRIFAPSRRYRSRHRSASPRSMPCAASPCSGLSARMVSFPKIPSARIGAMRENQRIILRY